jgi:hypothetical protein
VEAKSRQIGVTVERTRISCAEDRCRGELHWSGRIDFERIDPGTRIVFGPGGTRALVDRAAERKPGYRLDAPDLDALLEAQPLESLMLLSVDDERAAELPISFEFPDGTTARGTVPFARTSLRLALFDRLKAASNGPVAFPSDDAHSGPPRAMWVEFPLGKRGRATSIKELDWVLVIDNPRRSIECERRARDRGLGTKLAGQREKKSFTISDERARVYERRTGRLIGERTIPSKSTPHCFELFMMDDENVGGIIGRSDKGDGENLADWAWSKLR